ncbi:alpha/beta hydrolase [Streptomyces sp. AS02]|uniref:alpha/beta hydrolase n=1 Tax=Streptomyces sp. AS02 TaxID=2938946 RepID=UPI002021B4F1|nr:alpha/beta hydrolase [Streptomyces sp. AS02]MCL8011278.1 alpha/beta hydrolase [Streptomyces sp. AS02]
MTLPRRRSGGVLPWSSEHEYEKKDKEMPQPDGYIFALDENVTRTSVSYKNRFGITIAADLYRAKDFDASQEHPAIVIGAPYGGVKEQGPGIYAQNLARRGFATLTFDPSFTGESGGESRNISSPEVFTEDFSAAVDYLGTRPFVDRRRIGGLGMCGSGGFLLSAAQVDRRIRAVATVVMYDISRIARYGLGDTLTDEGRAGMLDAVAEQRYADFESGEPIPMPAGDGDNPVAREFAEFYGTPRGFHANSKPFTLSSGMSFMNFPLLSYIDSISPRPVLFVVGENAHSRYFSEDAYKLTAEPKEFHAVPDAGHVDLYDRTDLIPFDKFEEFFSENLAVPLP